MVVDRRSSPWVGRPRERRQADLPVVEDRRHGAGIWTRTTPQPTSPR